ncbi:HlyD family efflux transporter periplasmic adaptor subunit [Chelativorans sp. ZYF759]|uniref:efflux RND transporter periplasmic adaptor subunit n=1 Tax=Chelativorans sp. ZYF759 TaxID=2692213 RepID=UPI00145F55C8|nr:HlyD family efflux transporter periplasmic adaptor subunit [Chelativorans sp. ZYF759]NMG38206.1 HlyD family efflux transporter periplasmic adaptor subunit [Chelativorans sp. ZYF759]
MSKIRIAVISVAAVAAAGALTWAFWPEPVPVDLATVERGPMEVTVSANGVTRIRDTYLVTAPIAGTTTRSPVEVGDDVVANETVVATIQPAAPALLDARARAQAEAAVEEAVAALRHAQTNVERAEADLDHAQNQYERTRRLAEQGTIPLRMRDDAALQLRTVESALEAARTDVVRQEATLRRTRAQLLGPEGEGGPREPGECCVRIHAPASGSVLSIENVSARLVQAGEPLLTIGRPDELEIEVELLSADAVRISEGAAAHIGRWGGPGELAARVRRIEPSAYTRVSALGIEEQRVRVRLDLLTPSDERAGLGDNFRVFVRVVEWAGEDVLRVPVGALFRAGENWAVYRMAEDDRARMVLVEIGRRTALEAEVLSGLETGDRVVLYPADRIDEGTSVVDRAAL